MEVCTLTIDIVLWWKNKGIPIHSLVLYDIVQRIYLH